MGLYERIDEGFAFPLNPVWPVRDAGWYDMYERLRNSTGVAQEAFQAWYPPGSGLPERIRQMHEEHPEGFIREDSRGLQKRTTLDERELDSCERMDLLMHIGIRARPEGLLLHVGQQVRNAIGIARELPGFLRRASLMSVRDSFASAMSSREGQQTTTNSQSRSSVSQCIAEDYELQAAETVTSPTSFMHAPPRRVSLESPLSQADPGRFSRRRASANPSGPS